MAFPLKTINIARELKEEASQLLDHAKSTKQRMDESTDQTEKERLEHITREHLRRVHRLTSLGKRMLSKD